MHQIKNSPIEYLDLETILKSKKINKIKFFFVCWSLHKSTERSIIWRALSYSEVTVVFAPRDWLLTGEQIYCI